MQYLEIKKHDNFHTKVVFYHNKKYMYLFQMEVLCMQHQELLTEGNKLIDSSTCGEKFWHRSFNQNNSH